MCFRGGDSRVWSKIIRSIKNILLRSIKIFLIGQVHYDVFKGRKIVFSSHSSTDKSVPLKCQFQILLPDMHHCCTNVTHEGQVAAAPASCLTDHHGTSSRLYTMKMTFESIKITIFQTKQRMSVAVVTRPDVEQGSILQAKAEKLLSLHGPSN